MKVRIKPNSIPVRRHVKTIKPYFSTVAVAFKTYNDSLSKADLLFDAFSEERMQAQIVATDNLRSKLKNLGLHRFEASLDFSSSYQNEIRYAA